uniref:MAK10-like protein n=1 Tax=Tanacetum cinerariifolium TaxID=118510 RepID=A0A6L2K3D9_TANCI|nr:MAK10-like protein [Tanacetum cinerariifolium]
MGDENPIRTIRDYSKPSHNGYRNTIELPLGNNVVPLRSDTIWLVQNGCSFHGLWSEDPNQHLKDFLKLGDSLGLDGANRERTRQLQNFYDYVNPITRRTIDQSVDEKLRDKNAKESWALLEDLALYDNESWNDPRDFAKSAKAISLPQDVPSTSDRHLIDGPHDTQYYMENPEQAFVEYASSCIDKAGEEEEKDRPENVDTNPSTPPDPSISFITKKVLKLNSFFESIGLVPQSSSIKFVCTKGDDGDVMFIETIKKDDDSCKEEPKAGRLAMEYFDTFPT